jgi:recombination DNA repair RAD52 pathway protein
VTFTPEQTAALEAPLSKTHVKKNPRGFDYLEGWWCIQEANRIFGFDGWDRETVELEQLGAVRSVDDKVRIAYRAKVRITVRVGIEIVEGEVLGTYVIKREGTGYGSGIDRDQGQAFESAIKEAETDAMKRALMTFGNPFGLALYDKKQENVTSGLEGRSPPNTTPNMPMAASEPPSALKRLTSMQAKDRQLHVKIEDMINGCKTATELWDLEHSQPFNSIRDQCPLAWLDGISNHLVVRLEQIKVETAEADMDREYEATVR